MSRHTFSFVVVPVLVGFGGREAGANMTYTLMGVCQRCGVVRAAASLPSHDAERTDGFFDVGGECADEPPEAPAAGTQH